MRYGAPAKHSMRIKETFMFSHRARMDIINDPCICAVLSQTMDIINLTTFIALNNNNITTDIQAKCILLYITCVYKINLYIYYCWLCACSKCAQLCGVHKVDLVQRTLSRFDCSDGILLAIVHIMIIIKLMVCCCRVNNGQTVPVLRKCMCT